MRKILLAFLLLAGIGASAQEVYTSSGRPVGDKRRAQKEDKGFNTDNLIFGGGVNLQFGELTQVYVAPVVGYRFSDRFAAGIGIGYNYLRIRDFYPTQNPVTGAEEFRPLNAHSLATSVWARYIVFDNIFVQVEPEYNMLWYKRYTLYGDKVKESEEVPAILVGAGIRLPVSDRASIVGMLVYDVLQEPMSPYGKSIIPRFGVNIGF